MGRRSSIILPRKFRRGFRGATGGGGGGGGSGAWSTLGPNAPPGLVSPFPDFLGDTLPNKWGGSTGTYNIYGMGMPYSDSRNWEVVPDIESPSGSALRMHFYGSGHPRSGVAWVPPAAGGGSPVRGTIRSGIYDAAVPRKWRKMYIHHWHRFSPNWSVDATLQAETVHASGTCASGSTVTVINDPSKAWVVDEHVGRFFRHSTRLGAVIQSNTATQIVLEPADRLDYNPGLEPYTIFTWTPTATVTTSAGCKGWFWPFQTVRYVGPVAGRGDGAILGAWDAPKDIIGRWHENHYQGCWDNAGGAGAPGPGGIWDGIGLQNDARWDPPFLEDANDLPLWIRPSARFDQYPDDDLTPQIPYTRGDLRKVEYYMEINTPGTANGVWRVWDNGVLMRDVTNCMFTERYISALQNVTYTPRPIIGGASRDAAYEIIENYWGSLFSATTFGGIAARYIPTNTQWCDLVAMAVSGAP